MRFYLPLLTLLSALMLATGVASAGDDRKGHGAGGARDDHASEQGRDKGKAWAGSKEKDEKEHKDKKEKKEKKQKKDKKSRD